MHPSSDPASGNAPAIHHRLLIEQAPESVYAALTTQEGLSGWWTPEVSALPLLGFVCRFSFGPDYYKEMEVLALLPLSRVKWRCLKGFEDWVGTVITFELESHPRGTVITLHHEGWRAYTKELASCSFDWALFLRSLKQLCHTGKGTPYPDFDKV